MPLDAFLRPVLTKKWFNPRGESETRDMEKWRRSSQDREDGVRRAGETLLEVVLAGIGLSFWTDPHIE